jgi:4-hydroxy-3-methylbut-2-en-1-yl diphosphate reductase
MRVEIDGYSGFCPGVTSAIDIAEEHLRKDGILYCLGDIVHNSVEVNRLKQMGLEIIDYETYKTLKNTKVLIRAHGEPPETYQIANNNNLELIDATCPVVIKLQIRIREISEKHSNRAQIVIFGKKGHAEVNGLVGQAGKNAVVISEIEDINAIDFSKDLYVFSQTTRSPEKYRVLTDKIQEKSANTNNGNPKISITHSICPLVEKREPLLIQFAKQHDVIVFVSDPKSSNGNMLYNLCANHNERCYFISSPDDLDKNWFNSNDFVGICGATSTPRWLMEEVREKVLVIGDW